MLKTNDALFGISKIEQHYNAISATIDINKDCDIFNGHFPGQPVIPGACMLQIVKEVLEQALGTPLRLKKAEHLKFLTMIDPETTPSANLDVAYKSVSEGHICITAKLVKGAVVCFKFQGTFIAG
ncbi:3-hydroxyacyl-ACP dehydratase [Mucilaginibacter gotjawali]|uniref:FabA-like domain protein n=2 Tax=Mucilaginibacter gotjawali TaxID=1550579 RepID=A0A110B392_9SPHI|nr:3-hydroxyacyl-ACP dehydratase [Mucilaginibacter gotjawali]MBB3054042.1 3-hydroxyacyl-[acyl-carrier-protein] dehydratase [Mucilaginibacter gotjawali]BAU54308.1 FabA-like domain protein [Mucilaginibacter gotjawali]